MGMEETEREKTIISIQHFILSIQFSVLYKFTHMGMEETEREKTIISIQHFILSIQFFVLY